MYLTPTLMSTLLEPMSSPRLPPELLLRVLVFISDHQTLKNCSLAARVFVEPARSKLFYRINFKAGPMVNFISDTVQYLMTLSHLTKHFRSLVTDFAHEGFPSFLNALPGPQDVAQGPRLTSLRLSYDGNPAPWTPTLFLDLHEKVLPFLVSLTLQSFDGPLSTVTACRALQHLRVYNTVLYLEDTREFRYDPQLPLLRGPPPFKAVPMEFLRSLAIDGSEDPDGSLSSIVTCIQKGSFPALKSLDLRHMDQRSFTDQIHIAMVLSPLMSQLTSLDMGLWLLWDLLARDKQYLDLFRVSHYPLLRSYSLDLGSSHDPEEPMSPCLAWIVESFEQLRSHHPLEILTLRVREVWHQVDIDTSFDVDNETEGVSQRLKDIWDQLDTALAENRYLHKLERVVLPVSSEFVERRRLLEQSLRKLCGAGTLSFEWIDLETYLL
ncbi:hypothetical protein DL96DRAFT_1820504 [Flagelloscypha sp. PMI_526]|nr:hypothetical protein DL96DRAFT_1820504 [Flagelloscypha sp. PMI_526]